ncbi:MULTISPECIES: patatin-like phospholipase family protein [unclassified Bradyrhizobium]|uniref:patatin-like phospholipase family protein n=2 Tax=Bradyrhizobium TaxID=374 RepID=UPI002916B325|nr:MULTISPECIES: patatin-like phospholipase family protein [unclassified Bradyrhizobium]
MERPVGWRPFGEIAHGDRSSLSKAEEDRVRKRRRYYGVEDRDWAAGLALSGGGIRSATFAMGVMVALSRRGLLPQFDYLSTVSGGGYAGSFLTQLLGMAVPENNLSLRATDLPFRRMEGETALLRKIRQGASYLSGSVWERFALAMAQAQGIFLTLVVVLSLISVVAFGDYLLRSEIPDGIWHKIALYSSMGLIGLFIAVPLLRGWSGQSLAGEANWMALIGALFLVPPVWVGLGGFHRLIDLLLFEPLGVERLIVVWTIVGSIFVVLGAAFDRMSLFRPAILTIVSILSLAVAEALAYRAFQVAGSVSAALFTAGAVLISTVLSFVLDVNATSLHNFYRTKLAKAFLIDGQCQPAIPIRLSAVDSSRSLFPILNCALNVPGSVDPRMRGRHADVMSFTPVAVGAALIGYSPILDWESANPQLDLATAMALSGAAVSPQMGLQTTRYSSFWLTILNLRLGAWLRNPLADLQRATRPTVKNLLQELLAKADEKGAYVHISDGGHIENLGVYELLRRRCRLIVAVDGEHDERMIFHGLTNLQRLAYIDFGIVIEANLEDLRIGREGHSRSHFRFCRIRYPLGQSDLQEEIGYLVYLKLSLTGNEGEFIRRYKVDEPAFPHHSTINQFFTEVQFEAYRALGEHVGDKMFLPAISGLRDGPAIGIEDWFVGMGCSFLDPLD